MNWKVETFSHFLYFYKLCFTSFLPAGYFTIFSKLNRMTMGMNKDGSKEFHPCSIQKLQEAKETTSATG